MNAVTRRIRRFAEQIACGLKQAHAGRSRVVERSARAYRRRGHFAHQRE